jgi:hypothetical protein
MERLLLVLDELDDAVSMLRHVWLGVSQDLAQPVAWAQLVAWAIVSVAPGLLIYVVRF